jgi:Putative adhesin
MQETTMSRSTFAAGIGCVVALAVTGAYSLPLPSDTRNETRLEIATDGAVSVTNGTGVVNIHSGAGRQVVVVYTTHSPKVEVDQHSSPNHQRVEIRTHIVQQEQKLTPEEARVEYDVTVPAGVSVTVSTGTAPVTVDGVSGDVNVSSSTGDIVVRNVSKAHIHVRAVASSISLSSITRGHVEISSTGGAVQLSNVTGPFVSVGTTGGNITYEGDCSGGGEYRMTSHSGAIDVTLPPTASVELAARSVNGSVVNDFPLQEKAHTTFVPKGGSSFAGTSNSGSSSVQLQSFSGRIRVKKQ